MIKFIICSAIDFDLPGDCFEYMYLLLFESNVKCRFEPKHLI